MAIALPHPGQAGPARWSVDVPRLQRLPVRPARPGDNAGCRLGADLRQARRERDARPVEPAAWGRRRHLRDPRKLCRSHDARARDARGRQRRWTDHAPRAGQPRPRRPGPSRHRRRVRVQPQGPLAQGRDGPDAADARHGAHVRRPAPLRSRREHRSRREVPPCPPRPLRATTRSWPWRLTTPARGPSIVTGSRFPRTARRGIT